MKYAIILAAMLLTGCQTVKQVKTPDPVIITKYKYVMMNPPAESLVIPDNVVVPKDPASDKDVANLLIDIYTRMEVLETQLLSVNEYLTKRKQKLISDGTLTKDNVLE